MGAGQSGIPIGLPYRFNQFTDVSCIFYVVFRDPYVVVYIMVKQKYHNGNVSI